MDEKERIINILNEYNVPEKKINLLMPIIENVAFMRGKLDDARDKIATSSVAIPYDNGGGQKGIRENPIFKGYEALWKSYMQGMDKILAVVPVDEITKTDIVDAPKTVLELVKEKHRKEA